MIKTPNLADAHLPPEIARKFENLGVAKAKTDTLTLFLLAILAGAFISVGALLLTIGITDNRLGYGPTRLIAGLCFCPGLIFVVVAGAELFTGNVLLVIAWMSRLIGSRDVLRNWLIVYVGNVVGCLGTVLLALWGNLGSLAEGSVGKTAIQVASLKANLSLGEGFARGILCNALVCLGVWLSMGGRTVTDKIVAIVFPITAFVAIGFEHSIANWFFLPFGLALGGQESVSLPGVVRNLVSVTAGNIVGGTLLVGCIYWGAYLRNARTMADTPL